MSRTVLAVLALAAVATAQETPAIVPGALASAAAVCGPLAIPVSCWTWTRFATATSGPRQVSRCQPAGTPWWHPDGAWDRVCHADADAGQACLAAAYVTGPRRVVCDGGVWAP